MKFSLPNRFFIVLSVVLILTGLGFVATEDKGFFVCHLEDIRTDRGVRIFYVITKLGEFISYLLAIAFFLFRKIKWSLSVALTGVLVALISPLLKYLFRFPRPLNYLNRVEYPCKLAPIEGIEGLTGLTSFPSGHAMSAFALMAILAFILKTRRSGIILAIFAFLIAISRVYLGHHFLEDITAGASIGILISLGVYKLFANASFKGKDWMEKSILEIKLLS